MNNTAKEIKPYKYRPVLFFALAYLFTWVYLAGDRSVLACMIYHFVVNFLQEKIAMTPVTKCVETIVVTAVAAYLVIRNKDMFFETRHVETVCLLSRK